MQLEAIKVPPKKVNIFKSKGINTVEELLYCMPKRYLCFNKTYALSLTPELTGHMMNKVPVAVVGKCIMVDTVYKNGRSLIKIRVEDKETGNILYINIIGEYHMLRYYRSMVEREVIVGGVLQYSEEYKSYSMLNPALISMDVEENKRIIPVYRKFKGISDEYYKNIVEEALREKGTLDYVPQTVLEKYNLFSYEKTIHTIHHPKAEKEIEKARQRIVFDDMLYFTCKLEEQEKSNAVETPYVLKRTSICKDMISALPFELTNGQKNAIHSMTKLASEGKRVSSLVQGDVGSGKTMVAFSMMVLMAENGYQSVLMAPTAVLARQHYLELKEKTEKYGFKAVLLTNELKTSEKKKVLEEIKSGEAQFVVGTHSCIGKSVEYKNLALTVTDEEHKFGVLQREALVKKAGEGVHNVIMSGTPIPRTLANTLYGNATEVYSMELPGNRKPIQTAVCSTDKPVFDWMLKEIKKGHQCYVVCPLIDKAEDGSKMDGIASIEDSYEKYNKFFSQYGIKTAVVTGKTTKEEQGQILSEFKDNKTQILMATTVIEVGVNVPNATVMVITGAERFGLATLHQLRGRVGRGSDQSYCILQKTPGFTGSENLDVLCRETDGLEIAKADLKHRGTGNLLGFEQSGQNKYIQLMLQYPNMYAEVKKVAKSLCQNHTGKDIIKIYEEMYVD